MTSRHIAHYHVKNYKCMSACLSGRGDPASCTQIDGHVYPRDGRACLYVAPLIWHIHDDIEFHLAWASLLLFTPAAANPVRRRTG